MESSRTDLTTTLLRISRSRFIYGYHMRLPATIARLAELTGELASSTSDGLSERVVKNAVWRTIAAAVRIREFVTMGGVTEFIRSCTCFGSTLVHVSTLAIVSTCMLA